MLTLRSPTTSPRQCFRYVSLQVFEPTLDLCENMRALRITDALRCISRGLFCMLCAQSRHSLSLHTWPATLQHANSPECCCDESSRIMLVPSATGVNAQVAVLLRHKSSALSGRALSGIWHTSLQLDLDRPSPPRQQQSRVRFLRDIHHGLPWIQDRDRQQQQPCF